MPETPAPSAPAWPYGGVLPQRFSRKNYPRYRNRGGLVDIYADADGYAEDGKLPDRERFVFLSLAFDQIHKEGLTGDFAEIGVYKGQTATLLANNARRLGRIAWLLDTFAGFDARDMAGVDAGRRLGFTNTSLEAVRARVGAANTRYIQGYFPDTAGQLPADGQYCLVHIDCDLYKPIFSALEYFYPRMVPGGFIVVHDYGSLEWEGVDQAVDTFFADKPECVVPMPDSAGSVVVRRQRTPAAAQALPRANHALALDEWHSAARNELGAALGDGWSLPEAWGIWGIGSAHTLSLAPADPNVESFVVELDVKVAAGAARPALVVDVLVNGAPADVWRFTEAEPRRVRTLAIERPPGAHSPVTITLCPRDTFVPQEKNPASSDTRPLGVALHKLRLRKL